jgi:hypothetical protein
LGEKYSGGVGGVSTSFGASDENVGGEPNPPNIEANPVEANPVKESKTNGVEEPFLLLGLLLPF